LSDTNSKHLLDWLVNQVIYCTTLKNTVISSGFYTLDQARFYKEATGMQLTGEFGANFHN